MRLVLALGGNALLRRGEPMELETLRAHVREAVGAVASLAREHDLVVSHGNGPQVGLLALQAEAYRGVRPYSLDVLGAESEGLIGYLIEQELKSALPGREVATLLTQIEVDPSDQAFAHPTKPIGPVYALPEGERLGRDRGWALARDGLGLRRVDVKTQGLKACLSERHRLGQPDVPQADHPHDRRLRCQLVPESVQRRRHRTCPSYPPLVRANVGF